MLALTHDTPPHLSIYSAFEQSSMNQNQLPVCKKYKHTHMMNSTKHVGWSLTNQNELISHKQVQVNLISIRLNYVLGSVNTVRMRHISQGSLARTPFTKWATMEAAISSHHSLYFIFRYEDSASPFPVAL